MTSVVSCRGQDMPATANQNGMLILMAVITVSLQEIKLNNAEQ